MSGIVPPSEAPDSLHFERVVVMGGGCYGSWYARQIARALGRGAMTARDVVVVDHSADCKVAHQLAEGAYNGLPIRHEQVPWTEYLATWFASPEEELAGHAMVPSPLMPHLCFEWLMARAQSRWPDREVRAEPLAHAPATPWERASPDHRHYVSFATWMCPVNCIEPARCPHTRGVRDWSMPEAMRDFARTDPTLDCAAIFPCVHRTFGVGMIDAAPIVQADTMLAERGAQGAFRALVGTVSHCHGALGVLAVR
ncbi:MAG: hypothetical protein IBJ03_15000 [Gemmatimonadaceae bacterium]|nr:hypothetical protein [Gemmatimonadaceae bacterium]